MKQFEQSENLDEVLADCLAALEQSEGVEQENLRRYPEHREELVDLLSLVKELNGLSQLSPRQEFIEATQRQLMDLKSYPSPPVLSRSRGLWGKKLPIFQMRAGTLILAFILSVIAFAMTGGIMYATAAARPGDMLYGLNLMLEKAQLSLAADAQETFNFHLDFASRRLVEIQNELEDGDVEGALLALGAYEKEIASLNEIIRNANESQQESWIELVNDAWGTHLEVLNSLLDVVPEPAQPAIQHAIDIVGGFTIPPTVIPEISLPDLPEEAGAPEVLPIPTTIPTPPMATNPAVIPPVPTVTIPTPAVPGIPVIIPPPADPGLPPGLPVEPGIPPDLPVPPDLPIPDLPDLPGFPDPPIGRP